MSLVKMSTLLARAEKKGKGCGSFSVYSMEMLMGVLRAAEEMETPVILQLAEARFPTAPLELMGPMMLGAARSAGVDVAVHLDHGKSFEAIRQALELGFTSVMYDGSALPFAENAARTKEVKRMAEWYGADMEAELGLVGRDEGGGRDYGITCTDPEDAALFVRETGADALAVAIGNQHGNYPTAPKLRFDILREIHGKIPEEPLVLHGGSGITDADFRECIRNGIRKINIATAGLNAMTAAAGSYTRGQPSGDYYGLNRAMTEAVRQVAAHHIRVFNMERSDRSEESV
ncbi:MAG: ketose-bisphosphate aldolase [Oribacterium sp.]